MNKNCFIDKDIELTAAEIDLLTSLGLNVTVFNEATVNYHQITYLLLHSKLSDEQLLQMKNCKYIGIRAHNTDYVNKKITDAQDIVVKGLTHQHGINAVAEHTFSLIFSLAKNLINTHQNTLQNKWRDNLPLNYELSDKKLGIIGHGQIGQKVAELGNAFGMEILIAGKKTSKKADQVDFETVMKEADVISLHLSSKPENNKYIDHAALKLMKQDAILINTARGSILDYSALESELQKGKFRGIGLDVFDEEPLKSSPLSQYKNVILTPHIAYMTGETLNNMNQELILNLQSFMNELN